MDESADVGGADVPADDPPAKGQDVGVDGAIKALVVGDREGVAGDGLFLVLGQIQTLGFLELVVARKDLIELGGDGDLLRLRGARVHDPTELAEEPSGIVGGLDLIVADGDGGLPTAVLGGIHGYTAARASAVTRVGGHKGDEGDERGEGNAKDPEKLDAAGFEGVNEHTRDLRIKDNWYILCGGKGEYE